MKYLLDTNIFLEVLLAQERREKCKTFLDDNVGTVSISDFSLHTIGVILFRNARDSLFTQFVKDVLSKVEIVTLPRSAYSDLETARAQYGLDFDDAYQYRTAKYYGLKLVTMDKDFKRTRDREILYL